MIINLYTGSSSSVTVEAWSTHWTSWMTPIWMDAEFVSSRNLEAAAEEVVPVTVVALEDAIAAPDRDRILDLVHAAVTAIAVDPSPDPAIATTVTTAVNRNPRAVETMKTAAGPIRGTETSPMKMKRCAKMEAEAAEIMTEMNVDQDLDLHQDPSLDLLLVPDRGPHRRKMMINYRAS